ncbi:MAG TPA: FtsX-like permease family protein, partial [bacterium]|nr:FtsX-like permease family protein [bacterium]
VIGLVAALTLVIVGFGLHFLAIARGRVSESAIMQANGLPWSVVDRGLFIEQAVVVAYSVLVGAVLGLLMAWVILPVLQTSVVPDEVIPPTVVTFDARTLLVAAAALLVAAWVVGQAGIRSASRFRLHDELRALA